MAEYKKSDEPRDFKPRFAIVLSAGDNIIIRRDFSIGQFNPTSLLSVELSDTMRFCGHLVDESLKNKTQVYLEIGAPRVFNSVAQMEEYFENPEHCAQMTLGEGIVIGGPSPRQYYWGKDGHPVLSTYHFDKGDFTNGLKPEDRIFYKLAFLYDEREVCACGWEGVYPKFVRNSIDLTNKQVQTDKYDITMMGFGDYVRHTMVKGKRGLDWSIIKEICNTCCQDNKYYTTSMRYGKKKYSNYIEKLGPVKKGK